MNVVISKATHERAMKLLKQNRKVFTAGKMREQAVEITDQQLAALKAEVSPQCTRRPADLADQENSYYKRIKELKLRREQAADSGDELNAMFYHGRLMEIRRIWNSSTEEQEASPQCTRRPADATDQELT